MTHMYSAFNSFLFCNTNVRKYTKEKVLIHGLVTAFTCEYFCKGDQYNFGRNLPRRALRNTLLGGVEELAHLLPNLELQRVGL